VLGQEPGTIKGIFLLIQPAKEVLRKKPAQSDYNLDRAGVLAVRGS
jgi:hypothetical protein